MLMSFFSSSLGSFDMAFSPTSFKTPDDKAAVLLSMDTTPCVSAHCMSEVWPLLVRYCPPVFTPAQN